MALFQFLHNGENFLTPKQSIETLETKQVGLLNHAV